jgi:hypothetical protein
LKSFFDAGCFSAIEFQWIHAHDSLSVLKENPQLDISGESTKKNERKQSIKTHHKQKIKAKSEEQN